MNKDIYKTKRLNRALHAIRKAHHLLLKTNNREELIQGICDSLVENQGYYNAWIVLLDKSGNLILIAKSGSEDDFSLIIEQFKRGLFTKCAKKALNKSGVILTKDPVSDCRDCPLAKNYGGRCAIAVRLEKEGIIYGILSVSIPVEFVQDNEEHNLIMEIADDIAFGLHAIEAEEKRKQVGAALRESEIKLSQIIQTSPVPTFVINNKHVITHWNEACRNLTGISSDKMIGTQNQWMAFYSEQRPVLADLVVDNVEEYIIVEHYEGKIRKSRVTEDGYECEYFFPAVGNNGKWLFFTAVPLRDTNGQVNGAIETLQDISERKEKEARFRDLVENLPIGISIIQNGQVIYQNPEQERLLGPLPRLCKLIDYENIHPEDVEKIKLFYENISSERNQPQDTDFRFYNQGESGSRVDIKSVQCRSSIIEYNGRDSVLTSMMDVTRTKELENVLRIQDKMSSLGRVAAGIAHEIRNPLSGINVYLNTMEKLYDRGDKPEQLKQIFRQVQSASNKIESVIRRVMDFSKPGEPEFVLININDPVEEAINLSSVTLRKRGIKLNKNLAEDMGRCKADPQMIEQVILNLITNAAEAMNSIEGEKKIGVTTSLKDDFITVGVRDSGPGVPLSLKEKIFDPFYTTKNGGTGIGLSLCKRIIKDHNGSLDVYPCEWGGAEFRIEIPTNEEAD